ncbi:MAG TPA: 50S ribosomal protein L23 [Patescibacteria group bacterium]|nr:50S ribosomal protein L23 [Patescibacteria group bacterium]
MESYEIIIGPKVTEKTAFLANSGKFTILVAKTATKNQINAAVKKIYKVNPLKINITKNPGKQKATPTKHGMMVRKIKGQKKAIVVLKKGQKIPGFETIK